jgi:hypothetical protein
VGDELKESQQCALIALFGADGSSSGSESQALVKTAIVVQNDRRVKIDVFALAVAEGLASRCG